MTKYIKNEKKIKKEKKIKNLAKIENTDNRKIVQLEVLKKNFKVEKGTRESRKAYINILTNLLQKYIILKKKKSR
jgi:hypothetical protein